jgi:hypothetical protein
MTHKSTQIVTPALRTVGNIVTGDDLQTQVVLNSGVLNQLMALLTNPKKAIRKEAIWAVSNITAGNRIQIQAVIDAGLVPPLLSCLKTGDFDIRKEACWAVCNMASGGSTEQLQFLVRSGVVLQIVNILDSPDARIQQVALEGLAQIIVSSRAFTIKAAGGQGPTPTQAILRAIETSGGRARIRALAETENVELESKASTILQYYADEGLGDDEKDDNGNDDDDDDDDDNEEVVKKPVKGAIAKSVGKKSGGKKKSLSKKGGKN